MADERSTLTFPCHFPIKAMGLSAPDFEALVYGLVREHVPYLGEGAVQSRLSSGGKWLAVTVTFEARSRQQLDAIYQALSTHERITMVL